MKPNENAAREYSNNEAKILPGMFDHGEARKAHLSGQQHILDTLAEMAKEHEKAIEDAARDEATNVSLDGENYVDPIEFLVFQRGAHFGFTLGQASMQGEIDRLSEERDSAIKAMDHHINCDMTTQEKLTQRDAEITTLKLRQESLTVDYADSLVKIKSLNEMVEVMEKALNNYTQWDQWILGYNPRSNAVSVKNDALTKISEMRKKL